ncbi:MAG: hypothetical protein JO243_11950 [Solirubrobacterales bacterium]|nr:hypothetical protein [Solirubrobacterales bacterium]
MPVHVTIPSLRDSQGQRPAVSAECRNYDEAGRTAGDPRDLLVATCGVDDAGGVNALGTVGPEALLFLSGGYAYRAPRIRPAPRFDAARRLSTDTLSSLLLAKGAHLGGVDRGLRSAALLSRECGS